MRLPNVGRGHSAWAGKLGVGGLGGRSCRGGKHVARGLWPRKGTGVILFLAEPMTCTVQTLSWVTGLFLCVDMGLTPLSLIGQRTRR